MILTCKIYEQTFMSQIKSKLLFIPHRVAAAYVIAVRLCWPADTFAKSDNKNNHKP